MFPNVEAVDVEPGISPRYQKVPPTSLPELAAEPEPCKYLSIKVEVEPLTVILTPSVVEAVVPLALIFNTRSVYVDGIDVKAIEAAPPLPTVTDAILINVSGTFHPV